VFLLLPEARALQLVIAFLVTASLLRTSQDIILILLNCTFASLVCLEPAGARPSWHHAILDMAKN